MRFAAGATVVDVIPLAECRPDLALLPPADRARYDRFVDRDAADAYLRRQSELRRRLGARLDADPAGLVFDTVANDKPVLTTEPGGTGPPLHVNISRSGPLMALAIDEHEPIGVDIECHHIHRDLRADELAAALHPDELAALAGAPLDDILQCWVFKEAWIKWTGEGLRADLRATHLWRPGLPGRFEQRVGTLDGEVFLRRLEVDDGPALGVTAWVGLVRPAAGSGDRGRAHP